MVEVKKRLVIEIDVLTGDFSFSNEDEMTYGELLSALEYTKLMITRDWLKGERG